MTEASATTQSSDHGSGHELRCECGSLVAKVVCDGLELKCRRCKRFALIRWAALRSGATAIVLQ